MHYVSFLLPYKRVEKKDDLCHLRLSTNSNELVDGLFNIYRKDDKENGII